MVGGVALVVLPLRLVREVRRAYGRGRWGGVHQGHRYGYAHDDVRDGGGLAEGKLLGGGLAGGWLLGGVLADAFDGDGDGDGGGSDGGGGDDGGE